MSDAAAADARADQSAAVASAITVSGSMGMGDGAQVPADQSAAVASATTVSGSVGMGDGAQVPADQSAAAVAAAAAATTTVSGSVGMGDGTVVEVDQPATSSAVYVEKVYATVVVPSSISIGDITMVSIGKSAVENTNVGDGRGAVYGVEQGWIGLRCLEGDGMIIAVEGAAEVADGCPVPADGDVRRQAIVAGGGEVTSQVCCKADVLAVGRIWVECIGYCAALDASVSRI